MPNPEHQSPRHLRKQQLINFVQEEISKFQSGEAQRISTNEELRSRFGYARIGSFYHAFQTAGLIEDRRKIKEQGGQHKESITPSQEWAWMIGVLAGGGHNSLKTGAISVTEYDTVFLQTIKSTGERLMGIHGNIHPLRTTEEGATYKAVNFHSNAVSRQLGDLRRDRWFRTIIDKHPWILKNQRYIASFIEGIFDTRAIIGSGNVIIFSTSYPEIANFLSELLIRLGIENPLPRYKEKAVKILTGIGIYSRDVTTLAKLIHSRKPKQEAILDHLRQLEPKVSTTHQRVSNQKKIPSINNRVAMKNETDKPASDKTTLELLITEYRKAREICLKEKNRLPTILDIAELRALGVVTYTAHTLANLFGDRSFVQARESLEDIIAKSEVNQVTEIPAPRIRVYARRAKEDGSVKYDPRERLVEEYNRAREICLQEKGRLPMIKDIAELRERRILSYTAHTLANYFGSRSFIRARDYLEETLKN